MSSTRRGPRLGGPSDCYATPAWCVHRLLEAWQPRPGPILEPGAGDGALIRAASQVLGKREWFAVEALETCELKLADLEMPGCWIGDFLRMQPPALWQEATTCLGNPPYSAAEAFIRRCFQVAPLADVCMLLRLNFLGSARRVPLFRGWGTPDVFVLPNRPSFKNGSTDSCEYAWMLWTRARYFNGSMINTGVVRILGRSSAEERAVKSRGRKAA